MMDNVITPAMVFDLDYLKEDALRVREACDITGIKFIYPLKACSSRPFLEAISDYTDGFAASSLFEAMWAKEIAAADKSIHFTSPLLPEPIELAKYIDYAGCNSLKQFDLMKTICNCGIRVNPQLSLVEDSRYDPCCSNSKLGVTLEHLATLPEIIKQAQGLQFHSACEIETFEPLLMTVEKICDTLGEHISHLKWFNLGGGYMFMDTDEWQCLASIAQLIRKHMPAAKVFIEPGTAVAADCCSLEATVKDIIENDDMTVAILDTSVYHLPEALEFNYHPPLRNEPEGDQFPHILAGATCLAGDIFGEYKLGRKLQPGDRISFDNCGSYSIVKASMFNGIDLPNIYTFSLKTGYNLVKQYGYQYYRERMS